MADDGLTWLMKLDAKFDQALGMLKVVEKLDGVLTRLDEKLGKTEHATEKAGEGHKKHEKHANALEHALDHLREAALEPLIKKLEQYAEFEFVRKGVDALIELPEKIIDLLKELTEEMIGTAAAAQRTNTAFELLFGHEEGRETLEYLEGISQFTEFTGAHAKEAALSLRKMGFEGDGLRRALAAGHDMAAFSGKGAEGFDAALSSLERIKRSGRVDNRSLGGLGIGEPAFFKELSARTGTAVDTLKKQIEKGKIDSEVVLETLYSMITKKTGKALGGAGVAMSETLSAKLTHLKALPEEFFEKLADSPGLGVLTDALTHILEILNPESPRGQEIFAALDRVFTGLSATVAGLDVDSLATSLTTVIEMVPDLIEGFKTFAGVVGTIVDGLTAVSNLFENPMAAKGKKLEEAQKFRETNADQFLVEQKLREQLREKRARMAAGQLDYGPVEDPSKRLDRMRKEARTEIAMGKNSDAGLAAGLVASAGLAEKGGAALGEAAAAGTRRVLQTHSPSKLYADFGKMTAAGFVDDIDQGAADVDAAVQRMFSTAQPGAPGAGGAGTIQVSMPITIHVGADADLEKAHQLAEEVGDRLDGIVAAQLQSALAQIALQAGES